MQILHALQDWWQQQTWQEIVGAITGLFCVYLAAANSIWNWPIAIISTALYVYVYGRTGFYADMFQYVYLCGTSMYGWVYWSRHPQTEDTTPLKRITNKQIWVSVLVVVVVTPVLGTLLIHFAKALKYNPPAFPYIDSFLTTCSLVAQILLARKVIENWLIWIFVDIIYVVVYFLKHLQITSGMFAILIVIAIFGYIDWLKTYRKQQQG